MNGLEEAMQTYWELISCSDRDAVYSSIRSLIEKGTGKSIDELKKELSEERFIHACLQYVTTTKKSLVNAVNIGVDNACRHKRSLELNGHLVETPTDHKCPETGEQAKLLSTNKAFFESLSHNPSNQLGLFD